MATTAATVARINVINARRAAGAARQQFGWNSEAYRTATLELARAEHRASWTR